MEWSGADAGLGLSWGLPAVGAFLHPERWPPVSRRCWELQADVRPSIRLFVGVWLASEVSGCTYTQTAGVARSWLCQGRGRHRPSGGLASRGQAWADVAVWGQDPKAPFVGAAGPPEPHGPGSTRQTSSPGRASVSSLGNAAACAPSSATDSEDTLSTSPGQCQNLPSHL